jgi:hypothetical protein
MPIRTQSYTKLSLFTDTNVTEPPMLTLQPKIEDGCTNFPHPLIKQMLIEMGIYTISPKNEIFPIAQLNLMYYIVKKCSYEKNICLPPPLTSLLS